MLLTLISMPSCANNNRTVFGFPRHVARINAVYIIMFYIINFVFN